MKSQRLGPKEYRAALNGNSWKMALRSTIDFCMTRAGGKKEFQNLMKKYGYDMVWTPERKYITYICPTSDGKERRVRDIKLNDEKYLKENMEHEFRIRTELYGQAQGEEYTADDTRGIAGGTDRTGDSDGADQHRGMDAANRNGTQNGGSVSGAVGAESRFEGISGELRHGDEEGSRGAERGSGEGYAQDNERSDRTGWESERESFGSYREKNTSGRGTVVAPSRTHSSSNALGSALMGARGIANVGNIIEDDGEESEEEKRQREAKNAGTAVGVLVGGAVGVAIELAKKQTTPTEDVDDCEDEGFDITM